MGIFKYTQLNPVIFGAGAIGCVGEELSKLGCKKLLFVCGPNVTKAGNTKKAEEPVDTTACEAVEACEHHCMHEGDSAMCCKAEAAAVEGQACEHKCQKAEGQECQKACEHKCQK